MTDYESTCKYKLIYVFTIRDAEHDGLLKIGVTSLDSTLGPAQLPPNCDLLNVAARKRIDQYTKTALIQYDLLYTELAICTVRLDDGTLMLQKFEDKATPHNTNYARI